MLATLRIQADNAMSFPCLTIQAVSVKFDEQTKTEATYDYVEFVTTSDKDAEVLSAKFSGPNSNFPGWHC